MKIESLTLYKVPPRWLFLKIRTDEGLEGWGEPIVEGKADTVAAAISEMADYILGQPANRIEDIWQAVYRGGFYRGGPILTSALSGIEQALWDLKGKSLGVPIYELLGGPVRDRMKVYSWVHGDTPQQLAESALSRVNAGYQAIKMGVPGPNTWIDTPQKLDLIIESVALVREAVGNDIAIGVDFHGRIHKGMARSLVRELEPFKLMFIEEPFPPGHEDSLRDLRAITGIPIALGERLYTRWGFKEIISKGLADVIQPDLSHAGGILEVKKIAAMAEAYDIALAPHCPLGPIALAASLQVDFCTTNALIQEQSLEIHYHKESELLSYLANPEVFNFSDGYVLLPLDPGLGITIDEEKVRNASQIGHNWRSPIWRNVDGSIAEW